MKAGRIKGLRPGEPLRPNASLIVAARLEELHGLAEVALEPAAEAAQHDMRIAAKRLRYVLDVTGGCFGAAGSAARDLAKELQTVLGEMRDCDAMLPRAAGIESLESLLRTRRELLYARFRKLWLSEGAMSVWAALESSL